MKRTVVLAVLALFAGGLVQIPNASATFPGSNGKIAFHRSGKGQGIHTMRKDGTHLRRLTIGSDSFATWSPTGDRIAFIRYRDSGMKVMAMDADGSDIHRVSVASNEPGCFLQGPYWSYDGNFLAYMDYCFDSEPPVSQIRVAQWEGGAELALTDYSSLNHLSSQPWSPDLEESLQLTFISDRSGDNEVYVMDSDGGNVTPLTDDADDQFEPVWSPDGSAIAYTTEVVQGDAATSSIWSVAPGGGEPVMLADGSPHATEPEWSPDGARLAFDRRTAAGLPTLTVLDLVSDAEITLARRLSTTMIDWAPTGPKMVGHQGGDIVRYLFESTGLSSIGKLTDGPAFDVAPSWQAR